MHIDDRTGNRDGTSHMIHHYTRFLSAKKKIIIKISSLISGCHEYLVRRHAHPKSIFHHLHGDQMFTSNSFYVQSWLDTSPKTSRGWTWCKQEAETRLLLSVQISKVGVGFYEIRILDIQDGCSNTEGRSVGEIIISSIFFLRVIC
jgi:hypothetical protein